MRSFMGAKLYRLWEPNPLTYPIGGDSPSPPPAGAAHAARQGRRTCQKTRAIVNSKSMLGRYIGPLDNWAVVGQALDALGPGAIETLFDQGITIEYLPATKTFSSVLPADANPQLQREALEIDRTGHGDIQGLYVSSLRRLFYRFATLRVLTHELGHALDDATGCFASAALRDVPNPEPLTPYSTFNPKERLAEAVAAYLNADRTAFGRLNRARLRATDRSAAAAVRLLFRRVNGSAFERANHP